MNERGLTKTPGNAMLMANQGWKGESAHMLAHNGPERKETMEDMMTGCDLGIGGGKMNDMRRYLRDIGSYGNLTQEETARLFSEMRESGSQEARESIIKHNLRLVASVAKRYIGKGVPFDDLVSAGNQGLMEAVDRYDAGKGTKLTTYATNWIEMEIRECVEQTLNPIHRPKHFVAAASAVNGCSKALEQALGRAPTAAEIAECFGGRFTESDIDDIRVKAGMNCMASMDRKLDEDDSDSICAGDMIPDSGSDSPAEAASKAEMRETLNDAVERLSPIHRRVINLRFGMGRGATPGGAQRTFDEIAKTLCDEGLAKRMFSKEYIRQLEQTALERLGKDPKVKALKGALR